MSRGTATHPPRFPTPITIAITTAFFTSPPIFPPVHASVSATPGNSPHAATIVPAYPAPALFVANKMT